MIKKFLIIVGSAIVVSVLVVVSYYYLFVYKFDKNQAEITSVRTIQTKETESVWCTITNPPRCFKNWCNTGYISHTIQPFPAPGFSGSSSFCSDGSKLGEEEVPFDPKYTH